VEKIELHRLDIPFPSWFKDDSKAKKLKGNILGYAILLLLYNALIAIFSI
jgi:hypothetical protein